MLDGRVDRPVALDLCVGLGGWVNGLTAEGWRVIGIDIEDMFAALNEPRPDHFDLVIEDICNVRGADYAHVDLIVGSSPCQDFSYRAMPWSRAKAMHAPFLGMWLFWQQFRIQREICAAKGEYVPMIVENVRGAQPWVGRARGNFGSFFLWGDVPALMPNTLGHKTQDDGTKITGRTMCYPPGSANPDVVKGRTGKLHWVDEREDGLKNPGFRFDGSGKSFQTESVERHTLDGRKNGGGSWFNIGGPGQKITNQNPVNAIVAEGVKVPSLTGRSRTAPGSGNRFTSVEAAERLAEGIKQGGDWFNAESINSSSRKYGSKSPARKAASAKIAKIPLAISQFIGQVYLPGGAYTPARE